MKNRSTRTSTIGIAAGVAVAAGILLAPAAASAHVGIQPDGAPTAGSTRDLTFGIGHGCDGSPTTSVEIELPTDGIAGVKPVVQGGWTVEVANEGDAGRPSAVTFTADQPVPDEMRAEVTLNVGLLEDASGTLAFPVTQACVDGENDWNEIAEDGQDPHDLESPAPTLEVEPASADQESGQGDAASGHGDDSEAAESDASADGDGDALPIALGGAGLVAGVAALVVSLVSLRRRKA